MKKKRILIITFWIAFLALMGVLLFMLEYHSNKKKAIDNLVYQSNIIVDEMPQLVKNNVYSQIDFAMMRNARLSSLLLALEDVQTVNRATYIANQFYEVAGIKGLAFYNKDGRMLSTIGDYSMGELDKDSIDSFLEEYKDISYDTVDENIDDYMELMFSSIVALDSNGTNFMLKKSGPWIIGIEYEYTLEEENAISYFKWQSSLNRIHLADSGYILAIDYNDGTVLCSPSGEMNGLTLDMLEIYSKDLQSELRLVDLAVLFHEPNKAAEINIAGERCYAICMDVSNCLMLAVIPEREIRNNTIWAAGTWFFLLAFVTGICMLFSLFYLNEKDSQIVEGKGRYNFNRGLSGRLSVCTVLALTGIFVLSFFMEALSVNAEAFHYSRSKAEAVSEILSEELSVREKLENMYRDDELIKARVGGVIMKNSRQSDLTNDFMEKLAKSLNVKYCYYYDLNGNLVVSNSPYAVKLNSDSEFYSLLKGRTEYGEGFEFDETTEEYRQKAGVSVFDKNDKCIGALVIEEDAERRNSLFNALDYKSVLREADLSDNTYLMILNGEENKISYYAEISYAIPFVLTENGEVTAEEYGMDIGKLRDDYNGTISVNGMKYYTSVERTADNTVLIMKEPLVIPVTSVMPILIETGAVLLFMLVLWPMSCLRDKKIRIDEETDKKTFPEIIHVSGIEADNEGAVGKNEVLAVLSEITNKNKPYFEERWAKDSTRWRDKSSSEKFNTIFVIVCFFAILSIILQAIFMKENSIWFYCLSGEWDKGINLHSIVSCIITICILFYGKIVIHKLLYLTARASNARGETVCHLFDSFLVFIMYIIGFLICLANFGVDIKVLGVTGGITSLIISFSCQTILADMLAGILMTIEGSVKAGDFVTFNGEPGIVYSIGIHTTKLKWYGEIKSIRNNDFRNYISISTDLVKVNLLLDYRESVSRFEDVFEKESAYIHEKLCEYAQEYIEGPNYLGVSELGDNGIIVSFSFFCPAEKIYAITRALNRELLFMCERHNILLALPQVVVNEPDEKVIYEKEVVKDEK